MLSKKFFYALTVLGLFGAMIGCGGSDNPVDVSGIWTGSVTEVQNNCTGLSEVTTVNFVHTVNQNGDAIDLTDQNNVQYIGNIVGDDGFSVDSDTSTAFDHQSCTLDSRYEYQNISSDSDDTATVTLELLITCPTGISCEVVYNGNASRNVGSSSSSSISSSSSSSSSAT